MSSMKSHHKHGTMETSNGVAIPKKK